MPRRKVRCSETFEQFTLEESLLCHSCAVLVETETGASSSRIGSSQRVFDDISDEFSEPDPDSSDEWLSCLSSSGSSRSSSPDMSERLEGDCASIRAQSRMPATKAMKKGCTSSSGSDEGWHSDKWQPNQMPFTATPGPLNAAAELDSKEPADFLQLFLTNELLEHIVEQTNLYAREYFAVHEESLPHRRGNAWKPVTLQELKAFLGLTFLTGYVKKPSLEMYWSVDEVDSTPHFNKTMSRNRFQIIWRFLHYNDNTQQDFTDKMYKVRPVLDYVVEKFKELYQPGQNICIDEGMMQWRGRLGFRVYNPQKPVKYDIKSYILCDSATGYCFNLQPDVRESKTLPDIVFDLLDRLTGHGYTLYMDSFYNSVALCESLLEAQTNVCGTLRTNRGEPNKIKEVTKAKLGAGSKIVQHNQKVMVVAWQDKRLVKMVTTCHEDRMQTVEVWQKGQCTKVTQSKPECIVACNLHMNGVDKLNQNIAYYPFVRESLNWSKKFVAYLFQLCMFNAYVLFRAKHQGECKSLLDFTRRVVRCWTVKCRGEDEREGAGVCAQGGERLDKGRCTPRAPYNTDPPGRLDGDFSRHKLEHIMSTGKKSRPARRCRVCARRGKRSETKMWCPSCCVPLHAECFSDYHSKREYHSL